VHLPRLWMAVALLSFGAISFNAGAADTSAYGGAFEINDPGTFTGCNNVNVLTSSCSCPGQLSPAYMFRIINDSAGAGTQHGGWAAFCSSGAPLSASEFAGGFQIDDPTPGGQGCRVANATTGGCSCPAGTTWVAARTLTDSPAGIIGSQIFLCMQSVGSPASFGGAFEFDDPVQGGVGCRAANPLTGDCSCPAGFNAQGQRLQVDTPYGFRGSALYTCVLPAAMVRLCPYQYADSSGAQPADRAMQACLDATPWGGTLEIPSGSYRMDNQIVINHPLTFRTSGTAGNSRRCFDGIPCASLLAAPNYFVQEGVLALRNTFNVVLDHIVIDGNRSGRVGSAAHQQCLAGQNRWGFNAVASCTDCSFTNSVSVGALCGTGFEWVGDGATITNSLFAANGDHYSPPTWADGLTLGQSNRAVVVNNDFTDNSDIGFIFGGGQNAQVRNNRIVQARMPAFAGFMMDNFNGSSSGDFTGTIVSGNTVTCDDCSFGMNLGPHPWYQPLRNIVGGTVTGNTVRGGKITLNVDGAGVSGNPITVFGNDLGPAREPIPLRCEFVGTRFSASPRGDSWLSADSTAPDVEQFVHCIP
jgi:parallel beta helix pectate lyase-like protein